MLAESICWCKDECCQYEEMYEFKDKNFQLAGYWWCDSCGCHYDPKWDWFDPWDTIDV